MRSLFAISGFGSKSYSFDSQKELDELMRKVAMDTAYIIRGINPGRVIFAVDSKSWRKDINIEENDGYKGSRKHDKTLNWDNIYAIMDEFLSVVQDYGFIVTKIDSAEGDDVMALWADELVYTQNEHVITVSGDEDIRQLVFVNDNGGKFKPIYSTVFNPFMQGKNASRKHYVPAGFDEWLNTDDVEVDIWNMSSAMDPDKEIYQRIRTMDKTRTDVVDGRMIRLRKIFCGDDGDDIPSIFTWILEGKKDKNGEDKTARFTESKFEKLFEDLKSNADEYLDFDDLISRREKVKELLIKHTKQVPPFDVGERLLRQIKLVALDPTVFPKKLRVAFNDQVNDQLRRPRVDVSSITMPNLLQGTRYVRAINDPKKGGQAISIFNEIDRMNMNKKLF